VEEDCWPADKQAAAASRKELENIDTDSRCGVFPASVHAGALNALTCQQSLCGSLPVAKDGVICRAWKMPGA